MNKKIIDISGPNFDEKLGTYKIMVTFDIGEPYCKTIEDKKIATDFANYYREELNSKTK